MLHNLHIGPLRVRGHLGEESLLPFGCQSIRRGQRARLLNFLLAAALPVGLVLAAAAQPEPLLTPAVRRAMEKVSADGIRDHVKFLSGDLLEGRDTASPGERLAAQYLAGQFREMGLKPVGDNGGFFQEVPFLRSAMDLPASRLVLTADGKDDPLALGTDFLLLGGRVRAALSAPLVFVGHGITAPEFQHDDYKDIDAKGKLVVMLSGEPVSKDPAFFEGEKETRHAQSGPKIERAVRSGAVGAVIILSGARDARFPWDGMRASLSRPGITLAGDGQSAFPTLVVREETAPRLFAGSATPWAEVQAGTAAGKTPRFNLAARAKLDLVLDSTPAPGPNVVALAEGSDPVLKKQVVVYTAHYDHIGKRTGEGDVINNGAWDNASGTSEVVEVARAWAALSPRPRRSALFLLVTGEEKGLLGSRYYTQKPLFPIEDTAANINLDMTDIFGIPKEIVPMGAERSTLQRSAEAVAEALGLTIGKDPTPDLNVFVRSDQFSFAQVGVPCIFLRWAGEYEDVDSAKARESAREKLRTIYHNPKDEFDPTWSWAGMRKHAQMAFLLGVHAANQPELPAWNKGDVFDRPRGPRR
jgi:hypothetical protein